MNCKQFSLWTRVSVSDNFRGLGFRCIRCKTLVLDNSDLKTPPHTKPSPKKLSCVTWVQVMSALVNSGSGGPQRAPCTSRVVPARLQPPIGPHVTLFYTLHYSLSLKCMILKINFIETRNAYELHHLEFYNIPLVTWTLSYIYLHPLLGSFTVHTLHCCNVTVPIHDWSPWWVAAN